MKELIEGREPFITSPNGKLYLFTKEDPFFNAYIRYMKTVRKFHIRPYDGKCILCEKPNGDIENLLISGASFENLNVMIHILNDKLPILRTKSIIIEEEYRLFYETVKNIFQKNMDSIRKYSQISSANEVFHYFDVIINEEFKQKIGAVKDYDKHLFIYRNIFRAEDLLTTKGFEEVHISVSRFDTMTIDKVEEIKCEFKKINIYNYADNRNVYKTLIKCGVSPFNIRLLGKDEYPL